MQEYILCTDGKRRKATRIVCEQCGKDHLTRIKPCQEQKFRFCSKECAAQHSKKINRLNLKCALCGCDFERKLSKAKGSRSGLYFCTRKCKDEAQKLGGIKEIQPSHFGTSKEIDYRSLFSEEELICVRCGYCEFKCCVEIHHIDKDRTNNDKSNLVPLCSCCHMGLHRGAWQIEEILGHEATKALHLLCTQV